MIYGDIEKLVRITDNYKDLISRINTTLKLWREHANEELNIKIPDVYSITISSVNEDASIDVLVSEYIPSRSVCHEVYIKENDPDSDYFTSSYGGNSYDDSYRIDTVAANMEHKRITIPNWWLTGNISEVKESIIKIKEREVAKRAELDRCKEVEKLTARLKELEGAI